MKIDELSNAIADTMSAYSGEVETAIPNIIDSVAEGLAQDISANAPKRRGKYAKGWTVKNAGAKVRSSEGYAKLVCNPKSYALSHLLEYGHAKRGGGRVAAKPHIRPATDARMEELQKRIEEAVKR